MALKINRLISKYNHYKGNNGRKYIVIHYVGALGDAKANCEFYAGGNRGASAHFYVGFAGDIWQSIEEEDSAWSVGVNYGGELFGTCNNRNSINIEMCVRKRSTRTMNATDGDWYFEDATVKSAVALTKQLMKKYGIPAERVVRHYDVCKKYCPAPYVTNNTKHTWTEFKRLIGEKGAEVAEVNWYRVGTAWEDGICIGQIGAYEVLENAIKTAEASDMTMRVYDSKGNVVYTSAEKRPVTGTQAKAVTGTEAEKAQKMLELVKKTDESGILWSVTTAQMILESGYCGTDLAQGANNCFGMKRSLSGNTWKSVWDGVSVYSKVTAEQDKNGSEYHVKADFRKYQCVEDSIRDHSLYLIGALNDYGTGPRYPGITSIRPAKKAIEMIKAGGYATDVNYVKKILNIIQRFGLDKYDADCKAVGAPVAPVPGKKNPGAVTPYRVRRTWADSASQVGAYDVLQNAIRHADRTGLTVYDANGKAVYTASPTAQGGRVPFMIRVRKEHIVIRRGAGPAYAEVDEIPVGTYTIVETKQRKGHTYGRLLSGAGWVDLMYVERV